MLFFRHPRPIIDGRAVAVQIAQRKVQDTQDNRVLVIERKPEQAATKLNQETLMPYPAPVVCAASGVRDE
jgi:hypothetical protein